MGNQIATAILAYLLVQLFKKNSGDTRRLQLVLVWGRCNLSIKINKFRNYAPPIYQFLNQQEVVQL